MKLPRVLRTFPENLVQEEVISRHTRLMHLLRARALGLYHGGPALNKFL